MPKIPSRIAPWNLARHQDQRETKTETRRLHFLVGEAAEADKRRGIGNHDLCIPQADERDEHADSSSGRMLQAIGHAVHDLLANPGNGENQE